MQSSDINVRNDNELVCDVGNDPTSNVIHVWREAAIISELRRKLGNC